MEKARFVTSKKTKNFEYCLVQFETVDGAKAALKNEKHRILNANVKVKAAHDRIQPDSKEYVKYDLDQAVEDIYDDLLHGDELDYDDYYDDEQDYDDFYDELLHEPDYDDSSYADFLHDELLHQDDYWY